MKKVLFLSLFLAVLHPALAFADAGPEPQEEAPVKKGPNVSIDSSELEPFDINKKTDPEQKPEIYVDQNTTIGFNDDAQPSVGMRF